MKSYWPILWVGILLTGCTQKYVDYDVIHKPEFSQQPEKRPVAPALQKGSRDSLSQCFNQWFFFSNADTDRNRYLPQAIQLVCPGHDWLVEARVTQLWWTTILFTRACVDVVAHCPANRPKR